MNNLIFFLKKSPTIYTIAWGLYYLQGLLYQEGSILSRVLLMLFLCMTLYYSFKLITIETNPLISSLTKLALLFGVYGILRIIIGSDSSWLWENGTLSYFKEYELSILPVFAFYYFTKTDQIDEKWFNKIVFIFLIVAIGRFYREQIARLEVSWRDETTNNSGYQFVALLPCSLFLKRRPLLQYAYIVIAFMFVMMSMKRGAILVAVVLLLMLLPNTIRIVEKKHRFWLLVIIIATILFGIYFITNVMMESSYFVYRLEQTAEGNASGREYMYANYFNFFIKQDSIISLLIGNGADGTLKYLGQYAHNDWLEILIDTGLLGGIMYLSFWIKSTQYTLANRKNIPNEITSLITMVLVMCFVKSLFSMSINEMSLSATAALGYACAQKDLILKNV